MIEINLSPHSKGANLSDVGGFNFSLLNVKMIVIAFAFMYIPEIFLLSHYEGEKQSIETKLTTLNKEYRKYRKKVGAMDNIQRKVDELVSLEKKLSMRINVVKEIVNKRENPFKVLKYIAENIPKDVWIVELTIKDRILTLRGYSESWKSIGDFLENLKNSIFFERNISYDKPANMKNKINKVRVETFEIKTKITSFE